MGWFSREKDNGSNGNGHANGSHKHTNGHGTDAERRAAEILRRLGANGSDDEVVDSFLKRVDQRADDLKRGEHGNGKKRWW